MLRPVPRGSAPVQDTGEYYLPENQNAQARYEHEARYLFARTFVSGKRVLDAACGEGYGSALLSRDGAEVVGIDRSETLISHAQSTYQQPNLQFIQQTLEGLSSLELGTFDTIVCLETIEHVQDPALVITRFTELLSPAGVLIISTPNREVFSRNLNAPWPWHVKEFSLVEFKALLDPQFSYTRYFEQVVVAGSAIYPVRLSHDVPEHNEIIARSIKTAVPPPRFLLAVASRKTPEPARQHAHTHYIIDPHNLLLQEKDKLLADFAGQRAILEQMVRRKEAEFKKVWAAHRSLAQQYQDLVSAHHTASVLWRQLYAIMRAQVAAFFKKLF